MSLSTSRLSMSVALGLALVGGAGCSSKKDPPVPPNLPASPITIPVPSAPPAPPATAAKDHGREQAQGMFGYLRVRDPLTLVRGLGGEQAFAPLARQGLDLGEVRPGAPLAVYFWDPGPRLSPEALPIAALLPIPPTGKNAGSLASHLGGSLVVPAGESTLAAANQGAMERAQAAGPALLKLAKEQGPFDAQLYVNLGPILATYGTQLRGGLAAMALLPSAGGMMSSRPGEPSQRAVAGMLGNILSYVEGLRSLSVGLALAPGAIDLGAVVEDQQGTAAGPVSAPDLAQFLPADDIRLQWDPRDLKKAVETWLKIYTPLIGDVPALGQTRALMEEWAKNSQNAQFAMSMSFPAEGWFRSTGLLLSDNAQAHFELFRKAAKMSSGQEMKDAYQKMGMEYSIEVHPDARKINGWPVDGYQYHIKVTKPDMDAAQKKIMDRMAQSFYEVTRMGRFVLFGFNAQVDGLAAALMKAQAVGGPMLARKAFPAGGTFYADVNVPGLLSSLRSFLPAEQGAKLPDLKGVAGTVTLFGYDGGNAGYYRLQVPRGLLTALGAPLPPQ